MSFVNAPVHDMLIRIKNAYMARRENVKPIICSKFKCEVLKLLKKYWFIKDFEIQEDTASKKYIVVHLNEVNDPINDIPVIKFYSKPSRPWYVWYDDIKSVAWWRWIWILSTSKWLMASHEAKSNKIWWELIAEIY